MMNVVVLGSAGMLGVEVVTACREAGFDTVGLDLPDVDITSAESLRDVLPAADWIVNCAAYTRVDKAETERDAAFAVNAEGAGHVARWCAANQARLLHVSTDYVFDGTKQEPYVESDPPHAVSAYGASKLAGEEAVRSAGGRHLVVRTQSLYGAQGPSFVRAILRKLGTADPIRVVDDQVSSPTYAPHLADGMVRLLGLDHDGTVHVSGSGHCSWCALARAIAARVQPGRDIQPMASGDLALPAARPAYSVLDNGKYNAWTGHALPTWEEGLDAFLQAEGYCK
jgi:dTDP-4-dehydrorhamnose reductase